MLGSPYLVGCLIYHFASDAGIFDLGVPLGEAAPLLFLFLRSSENKNFTVQGIRNCIGFFILA